MTDHTRGRSPATCPVDHSAQQEWLEATRSTQRATSDTTKPTSRVHQTGSSWSSWLTLWSLGDMGNSNPSDRGQTRQMLQNQSITAQQKVGTKRTISSIPRTSVPGTPPLCPAYPDDASAYPNAETADPSTSASGNWMYPSESQFLSALRRKGRSARAVDMSVVVPIHNAVNERAWSQILEWEAPYPAPCGGPKLHSFSGDSGKLTPKARIMSLLGYQRPFDRHDWVVDRCGMRIEYVIDFYSGQKTVGDKISFYLDVRPKLNTWEGVRMRFLRALGLAQR